MSNHKPNKAEGLTKATRVLSLDGFRGLCILLVVFHNLYPYGAVSHNIIESTIRLMANMGWIGVQWFFVLSGFLITGILIKLKNHGGGLKNFYIRRALRIFPVYYLTLILFIIILPFFGYVTPHTTGLIAQQGWYWFYLNNWMSAFGVIDAGFPHLWSLAVEEQFYCIWPWLMLWLPRRWMLLVCVACVISSPILRYLIFLFAEVNAKDLAYKLTIVRWDALAMGALFAFAMDNNRYKNMIEKYGVKFTLGIIVLILGDIALNRSFASVGESYLALNQTLAALLGVVLLNESLNKVSLCKGKVGDFFLSPFLRMMGKYSYAIYIFHLILHFMFSHYVGVIKANYRYVNPAVIDFSAFFINALAAFILAAISWRLIEQPLLTLKNQFPVVQQKGE